MAISRSGSSTLYDTLVYLSALARHEVLPEARLVAAIIASGAKDEVYLGSQRFGYHCKLLGVDEDLAHRVIQAALKGGKHDN